ncbi:MAG: hypothetical protein WCF36_03585 [Candidatus Nanopelagicales bacterium]
MSASEARAWADSYKALVKEELDDEGSRTGLTDHTDDPAIASCLRVLSARAESARDSGEALRNALSRTWITTVSSGFCSTDSRPVADQTAILVDRGLIRAIEAAAALVGRHYADPEFDARACTDEQRADFARAHTTFLGQYFLFGRASTGLGVCSSDPRVDARVAREALAFVLAHELGHVMAGHTPSGDRLSWITPENTPADLHQFAAEIEADALAVQMLLGDMWDTTVGQSEVDARLFAIRTVLQTFETVEECALVPVTRRHLPARRRWEGLLNAFTRRFSIETLGRHEALWGGISPHLRFAPAFEVETPQTPVSQALSEAGWTGIGDPRAWSEWDGLEAAVWQYRLPREVVEVLVGYEAGVLLDEGHSLGQESYRLGRRAVAELVEGLPRWLRGTDSAHGSASSGDLIAYLRRREVWPEPFRSTHDGVLPIHTMASAVRSALATGRGEGAG